LVVVSIIALLISILLPSLSKARETARMVACEANLKQYGNANHLYADAEDGYFVPVWQGGADNPNQQGEWYRNAKFRAQLSMNNEVGKGDARLYPEGLVCPSLPDQYMPPSTWGGGTHGHVYGMNWTNVVPQGEALWDGNTAPHRVTLKRPFDRFQQGDANMSRLSRWSANYEAVWDVTGELRGNEGGSWDATAYRHDESANFLHFDGHVDNYPKEEAFPSDWTERTRKWNIYETRPSS